jgi:hypothetical protein
MAGKFAIYKDRQGAIAFPSQGPQRSDLRESGLRWRSRGIDHGEGPDGRVPDRGRAKHVDPRARTVRAVGYVVGLLCLLPATALAMNAPSVASTGCGTVVHPAFSDQRLRDAETDLRATGGTTVDATRLRQVAAECNEALYERRLWILAVVSLAFMSAMAIPALAHRRPR